MLEGPHHSNRWQQRLLSVESALLLVQTVLLLVAAVFVGYGWFVAGQYVKLLVVFGSAVVVLVLAFASRSPLFIIGMAIPAALGWFWP